MKVIYAVFIYVLLSICSSTSLAGWVSGGGEVFGDQHNPWFMVNKSQVNYCFKIDQEHVSLPLEQVRTRWQEAVQYWKREFAAAATTVIGNTNIAIATQKFQELPCPASIDDELGNPELDIIVQVGTLGEA